MNTKIISWGLVAIVLFASSCSNRLDYTLNNSTGVRLEDARFYVNDRLIFLYTFLVPDGRSSYGGSAQLRKVNKVVITWRTQQGAEHHESLMVTRKVFQDRRHPMFVIGPDMKVRQEWRFD